MKKKLLVLLMVYLVSYCSFSQGVGIGTTAPDVSAQLDITNTSKGLLIPRMSPQAINTIVNPAKGLMVYDSVTNQLMVNMGTPATPNWQTIVARSAWNLGGNSAINPADQFIGNTDNQPLRFRINNIQAGELHPVTGNIFWGLRAGQANATGFSNIAIGTDALKLNTNHSNLVAIGDSALFNTTPAIFAGTLNTAIGSKSLFANTTGSRNTAIGFQSLTDNTSGSNNIAIGSSSLVSNTSGGNNVAIGEQSLSSSTNSFGNIAIGGSSLRANTTGGNNTAIGSSTLNFNTTGEENTAIGALSLLSNTTARRNVAIGVNALRFNTTGERNTAVGSTALLNNIGGSFNTAIGDAALSVTGDAQFNTVVGFNAANTFTLGFNNTIIGANADVSQQGLFNCVALGESATCTGNNQVRLGNSFTTSIGGVVGFSNLSDGRYKKNIQEEVKGVEFIMKLRPVTYQLKMADIDTKINVGSGREQDERSKMAMAEKEKTIFSGFVAQQVEQAAKEAGYNFSGVEKPTNDNDFYGLRYAEFVVPLVKAIQEQQAMINELKKQHTDLRKQHTDLQKKVRDLEKK